MKRLHILIPLILCIMLLPGAGVADVGFHSYFAGDPESPQIAITVDDMYDRAHLETILDLCLTHGIHMTFFPVGSEIFPEEAALWQRVVDEGHEIGNHTYWHRNIENLENYQMERQLILSQEALNAVLEEPYTMRLFRPPYGSYDRTGRGTTSVLGRLGYHHVIIWNVTSTDPEEALKKTKNGSILLFHTNGKDVRCLETLIPMLLDAGFEPVTISELLDLPPAEEDVDGV